MERIISHFLGDVSLDATNLQRIADKLSDRNNLLAQEESEDLAIGEESFTVKTLSSNTARMLSFL